MSCSTPFFQKDILKSLISFVFSKAFLFFKKKKKTLREINFITNISINHWDSHYHILFYTYKPNTSYYTWLFLLILVKIRNIGHSLDKTIYGLRKNHSITSQDSLLKNKQVFYFSTLVIFSNTFKVSHLFTLAIKLKMTSALQEDNPRN